jgi:hypothetical protein
VLISEPGGPSRIWGGGGQRLVVEVAEHDHGALLSLAVQQRGGVVTQGDGLSGAQRQRVSGVARAFAFVARVEALRGVAEQLGLEVAGDEVDRGPVHVDADPQPPRPIWARRGAVVVELHARRADREGTHTLDVAQRQAREKADADTTAVRIGRQLDMPDASQPTRRSSRAAGSPTS